MLNLMVREKVCPDCKLTFFCGPGLSQQGAGCWCSDLPPVERRRGGACLCPHCLDARVADQSIGDTEDVQ